MQHSQMHLFKAQMLLEHFCISSQDIESGWFPTTSSFTLTVLAMVKSLTYLHFFVHCESYLLLLTLL